MMADFGTFKRSAISYWERRRILYNLLLVPPALFGYTLTAGVIYVGDLHVTLYGMVLSLFALSAFGANVCYTFAYAGEFLFGSDDPASRWLRFGRTAIFIAGVLLAMFLALVGGRDIAMMEFYAQPKHHD